MRPRLLAATFAVALAAVASGCSSGGSSGAPQSTLARARDDAPRSQQFDAPFQIAVAGGAASVTLTNLRQVPTPGSSSGPTDATVAVDLAATQVSGQPNIDPAIVHAYDPAGNELAPVKALKGLVKDPLVQTVLTHPGETVSGSLAWTLPQGARIGRVDVQLGSTTDSLIVVRQPADLSSTTSTPANG